MQQIEIHEPLELLSGDGRLLKEGWARKPLWRYDRKKIAATWLRIKEWDYYHIFSSDRKCGINFTLSDLGYASLFAITWIDLEKRAFYQADSLGVLPRGRLGFPPDSLTGDIYYADARLSISVTIKGDERRIVAECPRFPYNGRSVRLHADLVLKGDVTQNSLAIATSWKENRRAFYYNHKVNCLRAEGVVQIDDERYGFEAGRSYGGLDWGRGRWTYKNRWYWGSLSGLLNGELFGFNIGYGFSDRTPASENAVFYKNEVHKLDQVEWVFDPTDYLKPVRVTSNDGAFEMNFEPAVDRNSAVNLAIIKSVQHQVFGYFTGEIRLQNGERLHIEAMPGFIEDVLNWW
jgi:hypothetical protein